MNAIATQPTPAEVIESVLVQGDLSKLGAEARLQYYLAVCKSLSLNPTTKPFEYLVLGNKTVLYARRDCTEQLRRRDRVSVQIVSREMTEGVYVVTARATLPDGRHDESIGAVPLEGLKGEARSNAIMKAETKSKRRVTLSICGLGCLDESEVQGAQAVEPPQEPRPAFWGGPGEAAAQHQSGLSDRETLPPVAAQQQSGLSSPKRTTYVKLCDYEAKLVTASLCQPGDLVKHLRDALGGKYGRDATAWGENAWPAAKEAAIAYRLKREVAREEVRFITPEELAQLEAELARKGQVGSKVTTKLGKEPGARLADLTVAEWRTTMDSLGKMPDANP